MVAAGVIGALYILCAVILSVGVREKRGEAGGVRRCTGLLEEGCCTNPASEAEPGASGASHPGSLGPGGGGGTGSAEVWAGDLGKALQSSSAAGRSSEHPQRVPAQPRGLSSLCWQINIILHSFSWPRSLVPTGASLSEVVSKVRNVVLPCLCSAPGAACPGQISRATHVPLGLRDPA